MASKKFMVDLDLNLNELQNAVVQVLAADPEGQALKEARFWYNSTTKQLKFHNGTSVAVIAVGGDLTTAVTRALAASAANILMVSGGADRSAKSYVGGAGLVKSDADGAVSAAVPGTDYLTAASTNSLTNKTFDANGTGNSISNLEVADFAAAALAADLATGTASQFAVATVIKAYIDNTIANLGKLVGAFDASGGLLPTTGSGTAGAIQAGDNWRISIAGTIAGIGALEVGDLLVAAINGANEAAEFFALQANLVDAVTSISTTSVDNAIPRFDGTNGRQIQNSLVTISDTGTMNLPSGQAYQVNGQSIVAGMAKKYNAAFNDNTDWTGAAAPFTIVITAATHGLGAIQQLNVTVKDSTGHAVEVDSDVAVNGNVTLSSNAKFAGFVGLLG